MVGLICCIVALAFIITVALWVQGIDHMHKNYPDYKGDDLFGEDKDKKEEDDTHNNIG
jgi:hypothetical protein